MRKLTKKEMFKDKVLSKFQVYNSIFSTLPYESISNTGVMLPLFEKICIEGYEKNNNPTQIVDYFFSTYLNENSENEKIDFLKSKINSGKNFINKFKFKIMIH